MEDGILHGYKASIHTHIEELTRARQREEKRRSSTRCIDALSHLYASHLQLVTSCLTETTELIHASIYLTTSLGRKQFVYV